MINTTAPKYTTVQAAVAARDWTAVLAVADTRHDGWSSLWSAALTAKYGPTGLHADWTLADGTPDLAKLEAAGNITVRRAMEEAVKRADRIVARLDNARWTAADAQDLRLEILRGQFKAARSVKRMGRSDWTWHVASGLAKAAWLTDAVKRAQVVAAFQAL